MFACMCVSMWCVRACVRVRVRVYVGMCACMYVCACVYMRMYMYMGLCVCVYVSMCECVYAWFWISPCASFSKMLSSSYWVRINTTHVESRISAVAYHLSCVTVFTLTIGVNAQQLDITVGAAANFKNHTKGLMGVFNDDPMDDLLPPGQNAVPLSNSSSEKTIFDEFGELCEC